MTTTKPTLNLRQQRIRQILQIEKENGNDLTKKELMDKIRQILDQDYQTTQRLKEKELREEEIRRIRKLRMDGKITNEEEEYLTQSYQNPKPIVPAKEEKTIIINSFQPNPVYSYRNKDVKKSKTIEVTSTKDNEVNSSKDNEMDSSINNRKNSETDNKEDTEEVFETTIAEDEQIGEKEEKSEPAEIETKEEEKSDEEGNHNFQREKSELTLALENETSLNKLYELAEKMVFVSPKK